MGQLARRLGIILAVIVAFLTLQTGSACAFPVADPDCGDDCADPCDDEHAPASADEHESPCPPSCADCPECAGPSSAVLLTMAGTPAPDMRPIVLDASVIALAPTGHSERVDRPPRA